MFRSRFLANNILGILIYFIILCKTHLKYFFFNSTSYFPSANYIVFQNFAGKMIRLHNIINHDDARASLVPPTSSFYNSPRALRTFTLSASPPSPQASEFSGGEAMSVNDGLDPRFLYHVEDESLRFRVGESGPKSRELDHRRFESSGFRQGFCGNEKEEMRYSNGDEDVCIRRGSSLVQPGIDSCSSIPAETNRGSKDLAGWELVVREEEEEEEEEEEDKASLDRRKVMMSNDSSSQCNAQAKRDFASVEKERVNSVSSWESLKSILSDPVTGALMSDATILPCGHSFGAGGLKEVKRM
ncbi:BnaA03g56520D, partial [Brassica napus]